MNSSQTSKRTKVSFDLLPQDFGRIGADIMGRSTAGSTKLLQRTFLEFFGVDESVCAQVWTKLGIDADVYDDDKGCEPCHLLWSLVWLKDYSTEAKLCKLVSYNNRAIDPKEFRQRVHFIVEKIASLHPEVIVWSNRKQANKGNDCLISVDCTDCKTQKRGKSKKAFWSFKFRSSGLRYEIGVCILTGNMVWINGPFPCGDWPDLTIFREQLKFCLDSNERVEADDGYVGEDPVTIKAASSGVHMHDAKQLSMRQRVRSRHETVNNRIKQFKIVAGTFRHDLTLHGDCFYACAVLTQLMMESGHPLFSVSNYLDPLNELDDGTDVSI